jgi:hypothetical protein
VIADLSVHYVEGFIYREGHTAQRVERDYGYDLILFTYDEDGFFEPGLILLQLKATDSLKRIGAYCIFDVDVRDFNLWMMEELPVILIVYDARMERAYWLSIQQYSRDPLCMMPRKGAKTVRIKIPNRQFLRKGTFDRIRDLKRRVKLKVFGGPS